MYVTGNMLSPSSVLQPAVDTGQSRSQQSEGEDDRGRYEHDREYAGNWLVSEPQMWRSNSAVAPVDVFPACPGGADGNLVADRLRAGEPWRAERDGQPLARNNNP